MTQIIIVNSFRGGTGKSTIISNLSTYIASFGYKVLIIDADIVSPGIHAMFGFDQKSFKKTLTNYLLSECDLEDTVYDISNEVSLNEGTLYLMPSSIIGSDIADFLVNKSSINKLIKGVRQISNKLKPDFVMIDTHPGINDELLVSAEVSDMLINIVRPDNQDYQGLEVTYELSKRLGLKFNVILNKVHPKIRNDELLNSIKKKFKVNVPGMLPFSEDIMFSQSRFIFLDQNPDHEFTLEIQKIAYNLFKIQPRKQLELMHFLLNTIKQRSPLELSAIEKIKNLYLINVKTNIIELLKKGLIQKNNLNGKEYLNTTQKGDDFLKKYNIINKFVKYFRL